MRSVFLYLFVCFLSTCRLSAQELYFPPAIGEWTTVDPEAELQWCPERMDSLRSFLAAQNTKAFIVLKDGKIAVEWYFDQFTQDSLWYWASAGKSLMAMLVGIAQQEGYLSIDEPTRQYLGQGWTSCDPGAEDEITIWHQLTMTTGLDDRVPDVDCSVDSCLKCLAEPGTRWAYHNAPYSLLRDVVETATGKNINRYFKDKIGDPIGARGAYLDVGFINLFVSRARDMARYGLLVLAKGQWNGRYILEDTAYYRQMVSRSQEINRSYGYLWWLNGQGQHMLPRLQLQLPLDLVPNAPDDMFAALGKNDQKIYVVPSQNLVVIRMGNAAGGSLVPALSGFDDRLWAELSAMSCVVSSRRNLPDPGLIQLHPNPANDVVKINSGLLIQGLEVVNSSGRLIPSEWNEDGQLSFPERTPPGVYFIRFFTEEGVLVKQLVLL